jgi:hypothetical protein
VGMIARGPSSRLLELRQSRLHERRWTDNTEARANLAGDGNHVADELVVDRPERDRERLTVEQHRLGEVADEGRTRRERVGLDHRHTPQAPSSDAEGGQDPRSCWPRCCA